jgi:hypothetical protein
MSTYFIVSLGSSPDFVDSAVQTKIPAEDRYQLEPGKWLINSSSLTSKDVSDGLSISDSTTFFIAPIRGYYGRAKPDVWEWLAAKTAKVHA